MLHPRPLMCSACAGIRVFCMENRTQMANKERAFQILRSKLFDLELQKQRDSVAATRKSQVCPQLQCCWQSICRARAPLS